MIFTDVCFKTNVFMHQMRAETSEIFMSIYDKNHRQILLQTDFSISLKCLSNIFYERRVLSGSFIDRIKIFNFQEHNQCIDGCGLNMKHNSVENFRYVKSMFSFAFLLIYFKKKYQNKEKKKKVILSLSYTRRILQKQGFVLESHYAVQAFKHQSLITHKHAMKANKDSSISLLGSHQRTSDPKKFQSKELLTHKNSIKRIHLCQLYARNVSFIKIVIKYKNYSSSSGISYHIFNLEDACFVFTPSPVRVKIPSLFYDTLHRKSRNTSGYFLEKKTKIPQESGPLIPIYGYSSSGFGECFEKEGRDRA